MTFPAPVSFYEFMNEICKWTSTFPFKVLQFSIFLLSILFVSFPSFCLFLGGVEMKITAIVKALLGLPISS